MPNPKLETYKNKATGTVYDYTDAAAQAALTAILDGTDIDSFGDVETALTDKVDIKALSQNKETGDTASAGYNVNSYIWIEKLTNAFGSHLFKVTQKVNEGDSWASVKSTKLTDATACGEIKDLRNAVSTNASAISAIKDGTTIDSFGDVETALADYFPRSEQAVLGAYNELPFPYTDSATTVSGVTIAVDSDGVVTCSTGESGATSNVFFMLKGNTITDKFNGLRLVGCPSGGAANKYSLEARVGAQSGDTYVTSATDVGNGAIIPNVDTSTQQIRIYIRIQSGTVLTTPIKFKPMITRDLTATYADFQPYAMTNKELTEKVWIKRAIEGTENLNDITDYGVYSVKDSPTNAPESASYCTLIVTPSSTIGGGAIIQTIIRHTAIYTRARAGNPLTWTTWYKYAGSIVS